MKMTFFFFRFFRVSLTGVLYVPLLSNSGFPRLHLKMYSTFSSPFFFKSRREKGGKEDYFLSPKKCRMSSFILTYGHLRNEEKCSYRGTYEG